MMQAVMNEAIELRNTGIYEKADAVRRAEGNIIQIAMRKTG
jgi:hypothetical protein